MRSFKKNIDRLSQTYNQRITALVTGGSSGMGLEYARQLAAAGCNLLIVSNRKEELSASCCSLREDYPVDVNEYFLDLSTQDAPNELLSFCDTHNIEINILINNAGFFFFKELNSDDLGKMEAMFQLHANTPSKLAILFGERMKKNGFGFLLFMSSMASRLPEPGIAVYSATKAYLRSFGKSLHIEMRDHNVGVTTVCPAAIATPLYHLKENIMHLGVRLGIIGTPQWLVRRALHGMFRKKCLVAPGFMNIYLPPLIAMLPNCLVNKIWRKIRS